MKKIALAFLAAALSCAAMSQTSDLASYVNPFIGTGGHGHTHPAAVVPHGMIQPGPDTRHHGWDACSGYYYEDKTINGFSQTRLSGTGCADLSDFLLMPFTGTADLAHVGEKGGKYRCPFASEFSHQQESATPGYYSVFLQRYGIKTEITSTERTALYRFTYPEGKNAGMILDLDYNNQNQYMLEFDYEQLNDHTMRVFHRSLGWAYNQPIYGIFEFSQPFTYEVVRDTVREANRDYPCCKLVLHFKDVPTNTKQLLCRVALSYVDYNGAQNNLRCEQPGWDFEGTRAAARALWNDELSKIQIKDMADNADSVRQIFYTALYHAQLEPMLFSDVDGRYLGMDLKVHQGLQEDPIYTVFSLWDTHRALHPLISIIDPARNEAYIRSLIRKGDELGIVPKWELAGNETACMIGYHYVSLVADMYTKGYHNFNLQRAYRHALRCAEYDTTGIAPVFPRWKMEEIEPSAKYYKNTQAYIPFDKASESVARALEFAYNDWCISQLAEAVGDTANAHRYQQFGQAYRQYFDAKTGFMRGKDSKGNWRTPFDPVSSTHRMDDYTEGTAWQWTWFVPQDPEGLASLFGGRKKMLHKLDSLFVMSSKMTGDNVSPDISGMIGQYAHGNEPGHGTIFLYNYMREPWRTQELCDSILYGLYYAGPNGLSGNEDCGQMSAWYLLNAMGFYQFCPGRPVYTISRPIFGEVSISLPNNRQFTVRTIGNSRQNKYIRRVRLNGVVLTAPFFTHEQLMEGGVLEIEMSATPTKWGTDAKPVKLYMPKRPIKPIKPARNR